MTSTHYAVSMPHPHSHLFEVEARFPATEGVLTVSLPVWTPGSYLVREYARHLQELTATSEGGESLPIERLDKRSFRVGARGKAITLRYKVYANELTVRTSHLDGTHGYFNGATLFLYAEPLRASEHRVTVHPPAGWEAFCALDRDGTEFVAKSYDDLIDSPFEVGPHTPLSFTAASVPHQVLLWGEPQLDQERLAGDLAKICEAQARLFGGLPISRYLFLIYFGDKGRGGLEHKASTALLFPRSGLSTPRGWEDFLTLASHEYFHLWNVKRIKPKALVPFDYTQENYTTLLWAFEGITSYYDNLMVRRAGLMTPSRYLQMLGESLSSLQATPGRKVLTLAEASWISWIKHYRPDENSPNSAISYYLKGEIVALLLDLEIRRATEDRKSLDDVMRKLWQLFGDEKGVPEDGVEAAVRDVTGKDLSAFFDNAVRSTRELDYSVLSHVGLQVHYRVRESASDKGGSPPRWKEQKVRGWTGVLPKTGGGIATVLDGSPAQEAGLYAEDEVVALDGYRVDAAGLVSRCEEKKPGDEVKVAIFRRDKLLELPVKLGTKPADALYLARVESPTDRQKASFQAWAGASWEETEPRATS